VGIDLLAIFIQLCRHKTSLSGLLQFNLLSVVLSGLE
jgi:hypothetical protein